MEKSGAKPHAGLVDIFANVFTDGQFADYEAAAKASPNGKKKPAEKLERYYRDWRTYQMSDHNPMGVRLDVNASGPYLEEIR